MRITGRDLRRVINEEVRRSMGVKINEVALDIQQKAADAQRTFKHGVSTITTTKGVSDLDRYIESRENVKQVLEAITNSSAGMRANTSDVLRAWNIISEEGSASSLSSTLVDIIKTKEDAREISKGIVAALQLGYSGNDPSLAIGLSGGYGKEYTERQEDFDRAFSEYPALVERSQKEFLADVQYVASFNINERSKAELKREEEEKAGGTSSESGDSTQSVSKLKIKSRAPASGDNEKWARLSKKSVKHATILYAWMDFVKGGSATAANGNDGGAYTASFSDFQKWYTTQKADMGGVELTIDGVLSALEEDTDPEALKKDIFGDSYAGPE